MDWPEIDPSDRDITVVMPVGYPIYRTWDALGDTRIGSPVSLPRATRTGRIFVAEGNMYFDRSAGHKED